MESDLSKVAPAALLYSQVLNNRRGWNNRGVGLDIVIIINDRGGWTGLKE